MGHALCYCVYNLISGKIIHHSCCCEITPNDPNFCAKQHGGEEDLSHKFIERKALQKLGIIAPGAPEDDCDGKSTQSNAQDESIPINNADKEAVDNGEDGESNHPWT